MFKRKYFIKPPIVSLENSKYFIEGYESYSDYNYLRPGISSYLKTEHFESAIELTKHYFGKCNVIDFACADGPFLLSLSKHFNQIVGVDIDPMLIKTASKLTDELKLNNVNVICNKNMDINDLKSQLTNNYDVLFLLETLEHIGDKNRLYESKIEFITDLFKLINDDGIIVISVPKMVGFSFLFQRIGFKILGLHRTPISIKNLMKASILNNTSDLEAEWSGGHLGFNHKTLEKYLKSNFRILKTKNNLFHRLYVIKQ